MPDNDVDSAFAASAAARRRSTQRWTVAAILFAATAINYIDRANLSVAMPAIKGDFGLSATAEGVLLSSFAWVYAAVQIPSGWFIDRVGPRLTYGVALLGWSLATLTAGFTTVFRQLLGARLAVGAFESPAISSNNRLVANWFPAKERGTATAIYTSGQYVGLALTLPLLSWLISRFGWKSAFVATGCLGIAFAFVWFSYIRDSPKRFSGTGRAAPVADRNRVNWHDVGYLLSKKRLWGLYIGQFASGSVLFFFLTWFPNYLVTAKGMSIIQAGGLTAVPYMAAMLGVLCSGMLSDKMIRSGISANIARKGPVMAGFVIAPVMVASDFTNSAALVITIMSAAFFAQGLMGVSWTIVSDVAPHRLVGLTGGIFNCVASFGGALTPLLIGVIVDATGSFLVGFYLIAAFVIVALLAYIFMVDRVERLPDRPGADDSGDGGEPELVDQRPGVVGR